LASCPSVCLILILNQLSDFHETSVNFAIVVLSFIIINNNKVAVERNFEVGATLAPFDVGSRILSDNRR